MAIRITADQAYPILPSIDDKRNELIEKVNLFITKFILAGFEYTLRDKTYHFSFDDQDQANFTQEMLRAVNVATQGEAALAAYTASWRGHEVETGATETLSLNLKEFNDLAMYAGTWKGRVLAYGWTIKNSLSECKTSGELDALNRFYKIDEIYLLARDNQPFSLDLPKESGGTSADGSTVADDIATYDAPPLYFHEEGNTDHEVVGEPNSTHKMELIIGPSKDGEGDVQWHLHMFAYQCQVTNFHTHPTYGPGDGQGFDGTLAELREWCKDAAVIINDGTHYGYVDISLYPVVGSGMSTVNYQATPNTLPPLGEDNAVSANDKIDYPDGHPAPEPLPETGDATTLPAPVVVGDDGSLDAEAVAKAMTEQAHTIQALQQQLAALQQQQSMSSMAAPMATANGTVIENVGNTIAPTVQNFNATHPTSGVAASSTTTDHSVVSGGTPSI